MTSVEAEGQSEPGRALRADARINHDRVLEAATAEFLREGDAASMRSIAKAAGVGAGTLYRRFPTRDLLVQAVYATQIEKLSEAAATLLDTLPPVEALRAWMRQFADFMATKHELGSSLKAILADEEDRLRTRARLAAALATLLDAGRAQGALRSDVSATDVMWGFGGVVLIASEADDPGLQNRLIDLVIDGLRL